MSEPMTPERLAKIKLRRNEIRLDYNLGWSDDWVDEILAEVERLQGVVKTQYDTLSGFADGFKARAEAAEAERDALRQELDGVLKTIGPDPLANKEPTKAEMDVWEEEI